MSLRGWTLARAVGLAVAVAMLSPVSPVVLVFVPLAVLLLAYHPRSLTAVALALVILLSAFAGARAGPAPLWFAERAWALMLGGGFVLSGILVRSRAVTVRSVTALAGTAGVLALTAGVRPQVLPQLDWWMSSELRRVALGATEWLQGVGAFPGVESTVQRMIAAEVLLYPAFLALASVASLSVGWYVVSRFAGVGGALGPLREFRFSDHLVWVLVAGLVLFLLPLGGPASRLGENAVVFMGGLYLLRGLGILLWCGAALVSSAWWAAVWAVVAVLLYPVVVGAALLMGLSDTWLDLRGRLSRLAGEGD
ncbi:MAG: DUF2232 domain-containing protein [Gemmatimonadota bacterium]